jgi:hypothetical protein
MKKISYFIVFLILSAYILSEFIGDKFIKSVVEKNISSTLDRKVEIGSLNISYLKGAAFVENIKLYNKDFADELLNINNIHLKLNSLSIFNNVIEIDNVDIDGLNLNYYFKVKKAKVIDNIRSLNKTLKKNEGQHSNNKYFNINELNVKNIVVSVNSAELNINQQIPLTNLKFTNIGNTEKSNDYKKVLKDFMDQTIKTVKSKALNVNLKNKLKVIKNIDEDLIKKTIKEKIDLNTDILQDKLKNKLKKLIK